MSIVMKNNSMNLSTYDPSPVINAMQLASLDGGGKPDIDYGFSDIGERTYHSLETIAIIVLEMVRGLRWKPFEAPEETINCPAGMTFIIPAHMSCAIVWPKNTAHLTVTLDTSFFSAEESEEATHNWTPIHFSNRQCLQLAQILWGELQVSPHVSSTYMDAFRTVLTGVLVRNASIARGSNKQQFGLSNYACRQIENYLRENYRQQVSVPDMASLIGISAGHFATCFRASFGLTPHQYLMRLRLDEAERCLRETDISLSELAATLGFSSQSHMTTALRKYRHLTPGEVRRRSYAQRRKNLS
ncbi:AraC family transcriptional regulator [Ochrobactrum teleogrylli]|uniref:AraC family transcriptional regulator n=1 Tax=Ochrobactrum teleogrylli TaxID=2479765 RepID=A0ABD5JXY5_9HYPH